MKRSIDVTSVALNNSGQVYQNGRDNIRGKTET